MGTCTLRLARTPSTYTWIVPSRPPSLRHGGETSLVIYWRFPNCLPRERTTHRTVALALFFNASGEVSRSVSFFRTELVRFWLQLNDIVGYEDTNFNVQFGLKKVNYLTSKCLLFDVVDPVILSAAELRVHPSCLLLDFIHAFLRSVSEKRKKKLNGIPSVLSVCCYLLPKRRMTKRIMK